MTVTLNQFQHLVGRDSATETPSHFQTLTNLGDGETLLLTCKKLLPLESPGQPYNPYSAITDVTGLLARTFGGEYESTIPSVLLGTFTDATEEQPEQFEVATDSINVLMQALVLVDWPLNNPPQDVGLESTFAKKHGAIYYHRVNTASMTSDFSIAHGTDLWVMPAKSLGDFWQEVQSTWNRRAVNAEYAFRRYALEAPHFRQLISEYKNEVETYLHGKLSCGDASAELTISAGADDADPLTIPVYYQVSGLKLVRDTIREGLYIQVLGGVTDKIIGMF